MTQFRPAGRANAALRLVAAQVRLLFGNRNLTAAVTVAGSLVLSRLEWSADNHVVITAWAGYMILLACARFALAARYYAAAPPESEAPRWASAFTLGAALAGVGWGIGGILLYPVADLISQ